VQKDKQEKGTGEGERARYWVRKTSEKRQKRAQEKGKRDRERERDRERQRDRERERVGEKTGTFAARVSAVCLSLRVSYRNCE